MPRWAFVWGDFVHTLSVVEPPKWSMGYVYIYVITKINIHVSLLHPCDPSSSRTITNSQHVLSAHTNIETTAGFSAYQSWLAETSCHDQQTGQCSRSCCLENPPIVNRM